MKSFSILFFLCLSSGILATSDPATGHYLGKKPTDSWISTASPVRQNSDIQAAECSHNTRMSNQKFAWFKIDPSKVNQHESTYGTCYATSLVPTDSDLEANSGYDVFFWQNSGGEGGVGTGPIRDPNNGTPGYEDNSGAFHTGTSSNDSSGGSYKSSGGSDASSTSGGSDDTSASGSKKGTSSGGNDSTGTISSGSGTGTGTGTTSSGSGTGSSSGTYNGTGTGTGTGTSSTHTSSDNKKGTSSSDSDTSSISSGSSTGSTHKTSHKHSQHHGSGSTTTKPYGGHTRKRSFISF